MSSSSNGMTVEDLAETAWNVYQIVLEEPRIPLPDVRSGANRWGNVARVALGLLDRRNPGAIKPRLLAKRLYYSLLPHRDVQPFELLPGSEQLAWHAIGRHLAFVLSCDNRPHDLPEREAYWGEWSKRRERVSDVG